MKTFIRFIIIAVLMAAPLASFAKLIIYKGSRSDLRNGDGYKVRLLQKLILVVDYQNVQASVIDYVSNRAGKVYFVWPLDDLHFVQVRGGNGDYTALAKQPSQCAINDGVTGESISFKGKNAELKLDGSSKVIFPKIMNGDSGMGLFFSDISGQPGILEGAWKVGFDRTGTVASNKAGETFDEAVARYTNDLESMGYAKFE